MPYLVETAKEFDAKHGERVLVHERWLYIDGAQQSYDDQQRTEPPVDELRLLKLKIEFLEGKIAKKVKNYNEARGDVSARLNMLANRSVRYNLPPVADEEIEALKRGASEIEDLREELEALRHLIPTPEHVVRRNEQEREQAKQVAATRGKFNELPNF